MAHLRRPSSISSSSLSRATLIQDLYTAAYDAARLAVESDSSGAYTEAREAYIDAIQQTHTYEIYPADEAERRMIVQKSAEYSNRAEQLYRYSFTAIISSHPDASQHAISHDRKSHKSIVETGRDKSSNIEDDYWEPKSEAAVLLEKAHFTLDQAVLNEEKEILDHSLELYKDAAENFLTAYRKLPKDDERCKICHELCMQAMNKVEELKRNSSTNGHFLSPPSRDSHHDTRSISSITSSVHSMTISNSGASDLEILLQYMKLMGGYDFPGSNSGIDLYTLTGWIPEHIFVEDKDFVANNVWERLMGGQKYGDVLVTISTGEMSEETAAERGLVPTHAYAVIDIREVNGVRFMQVKNPWSHLRWKGPYSHIDKERWTPELTKALNYDPSLAMEYDDGIFWIDFDSVCQNFVSIHLNWNPELFMYRWALHIPWHSDIGPKKDTYNLGYNPQFKLVVNVPEKKTSAVWLLMSKHIMVTEQKNVDFITLHVYNDTTGERVYHHGKAYKEGTYVNSPHILVRFNAPSGTSTYTIVFSQHEKLKTLYFSLKVFSFSPFQLTEVPQTYPIEKKISGRWTEQTSGGNASNASFMNNPQWKLSILPPEAAETVKCGVIITLEAPKDFAVHLLLIDGGKRIARLVIFSPPVSVPEKWCHKPIHISMDFVAASCGTLDVSLLRHNTQYTIDSIPAEGAGMFRKVINSEWIVGYNAMGCSTYRNYHRNPRYLLEIRELTTVRVRLQTDGIDPIPPTNITIYEKHPTSIFGREVATSGPYTNVIQGVATGDTVLMQNAHGYVMVFATHQKDVAGKFVAYLYSDRPVNVRQDKIASM
ncbi:hypothetical protein NQZ79_g2001 [Umbelopsis isabellina]|nr:hypothetical protein NQZ79_g2001 [Umbelopsis isabellina]